MIEKDLTILIDAAAVVALNLIAIYTKDLEMAFDVPYPLEISLRLIIPVGSLHLLPFDFRISVRFNCMGLSEHSLPSNLMVNNYMVPYRFPDTLRDLRSGSRCVSVCADAIAEGPRAPSSRNWVLAPLG